MRGLEGRSVRSASVEATDIYNAETLGEARRPGRRCKGRSGRGRMKRDAPGDRTYAHVEMGNLVPGPGPEIPGVVLVVAPITARSYFLEIL